MRAEPRLLSVPLVTPALPSPPLRAVIAILSTAQQIDLPLQVAELLLNARQPQFNPFVVFTAVLLIKRDPLLNEFVAMADAPQIRIDLVDEGVPRRVAIRD